ncbi:hypothetical protein PROVRETT_08175 [Providencia rettgeri DSM 1131]|nr:hypothetical protein PROVRETT_08175 [Providencia rettgeri DSM 1131]
MLWQLTQNSVVLVTFIPTWGTTINATPTAIPTTINVSIDQRALGFRNALQSFRIIAPVIIWFNTGDLIELI